MPKSMYYILYKSVVATNIRDIDIQNIISTAQKLNLELQITGMLLHIDNNFMQIIEGEREVIEKLYSKICRDTRHYSVGILSAGEIKERFFKNWSVGFRVLTAQDLADMQALNNMPAFTVDELLNSTNAHYAIELLKSFYKNGEMNFQNFWKGV